MNKRGKQILKKRRTTVSLSPDLRKKGQERARQAHRNFSNYVEVLIADDLARGEAA